jgi:hypothetical protein
LTSISFFIGFINSKSIRRRRRRRASAGRPLKTTTLGIRCGIWTARRRTAVTTASFSCTT